MIPALTSEFFGVKHFGANYGMVGIAPALGSELLSTLLAGKLNDEYKQSRCIFISFSPSSFLLLCFFERIKMLL